MSLKTRVGLLAGAAALTLTSVSNAAPATSGDDVAQRLAAAEAKIAAMEAAQNQNWLTEQRASEIKGLVQDVLADADTRASLLQAGATAGYDNGFVLGSADGNWLLRTNFLMQQRFIWNNQDDEAAEEGDTNRYGFENTRSKFILSGHVVNPSWFYRVDINVANNGNSGINSLDSREGTLNAYLGHDYGNGWRVMMGSMKLPFMREELVEPQYQLAVERSLQNYIFSTGYADGLAASYEGEMWRFTAMFSDGFTTGQTPWNLSPPTSAEYAFTGRAEFMLSGNWEQFNDFTSAPGGETGVLLGGAAHWEQSEYGTMASKTEYLFLTGDVSVEFGGANLYAALVWTDTEVDGMDSESNPWGFLVQGGFYLNDDWELFARLEWTDFDIEGADDDELILGTFGVNRYFAGHNAKWTTDLGYAFDAVPFGSPITGWREDGTDEDGQWVVRTQMQLFF